MAQLKISTLSVGDWVQDKEGTPAKILGIEQWSGEYYLNVEVNGADVGNVIAKGALPIPITPEILEKNGVKETEFVKDSGYEFYQRDDFYALRVEGSKWWTIIVSKECREVVKCYVQHVHQMQHALRLAGVEKEIEL